MKYLSKNIKINETKYENYIQHNVQAYVETLLIPGLLQGFCLNE